MNSNVLRELFLDYFKRQGHAVIPSASLVPAHDPSLLFTNAGMVPFKDIFLGLESRPYSRAVSIQRCMRAGGKHNDLENVGYTARHHTFFEMLGNFSFGDYFKREAIIYSWDFLTNELKLPPEKLWITVFNEDDEAASIWLDEIKIDARRFSYCGETDNFWSMGESGPCGPCSEVFYDHGASVSGGAPGTPTADGDRYVEIWNLVFMQYQRSKEGLMSPLPKPSVDTGMGLERLAAVMQGVTNNYDTDLFQPLIKAVAKQAGISDFSNISLRVIADHIRACAFLISDGVLPGNEGRPYVLRRIMRRAIRHGHKIGLDKPFFYRLVEPLARQMQQAYPELTKKQKGIEEAILQEEHQFARTLTHGMKLLEEEIIQLQDKKQLSGEVLFRLYDTYGFPIDLTADVARERGLTVDVPGFEFQMKHQRHRSKAASQFATPYISALREKPVTEFTGHTVLLEDEATILGLLKGGESVTELSAGEEAYVILNKTPFYAESGGQIGDTGLLIGKKSEFLVTSTIKEGDVILHVGRVLKGLLKKEETIKAQIDSTKRHAITLNHSATHLLHAALRQIFGNHIIQKGSLVEAERLRFDFSHPKPLSTEELKAVEDLVNHQIRANWPVLTEIMPLEKAKQTGAVAIFGEKYTDSVRVLTMGDFSKELCGGTHVTRTGDIGFFKITAELGIASGIRRIQAVTGQAAIDWVMFLEGQTKQLAKLFHVPRDDLLEKVHNELRDKQALQKQIEELQRSIVSMMSDELISHAVDLQGVQLLMSEISGVDVTGLRHLLDQLKSKLQRAIIILASSKEDRVQLLISVANELTARISANELAQKLAPLIGGKGGGRPDFAQAGGNRAQGLDIAFKNAKNWLEARLNDNYA